MCSKGSQVPRPLLVPALLIVQSVPTEFALVLAAGYSRIKARDLLQPAALGWVALRCVRLNRRDAA